MNYSIYLKLIRNFVFLFLILTGNFLQAQSKEELIRLKATKNRLLLNKKLIEDSLVNIESKISNYNLSLLNDTAKTSKIENIGFCKSEAKLKLNPMPLSDILLIIPKGTFVKILDYIDGYFGVCYNGKCGYLSEIYIEENEILSDYVKLKENQKEELKKLSKINSTKENLELEEKYKKKYGLKQYERLKRGEYWIGMSYDMAVISLGYPKDSIYTLSEFGSYETCIYGSLYLFFENGKLVSYTRY